LIEDCKANRNSLKGFHHETSILRTAFIGNHTIANGTKSTDEYDIVGGIISLHEASLVTGILCHIQGGSTLGTRFSNVRSI
jgi:hypothetical protein